VESAVVKVIPRDQPLIRPEEEQSFREFVQSAFGYRRKQMRRVVRELVQTGLGVKRPPTRLMRELLPITAEQADVLLLGAGISPELRPESLTPQQFVGLFRLLAAPSP
jgi:16S rRNA A1518/A1519 N6-dimethyltransferase RsmA/KsgA/DIM1 with predicted DNA glycosylase/AP lyase activity